MICIELKMQIMKMQNRCERNRKWFTVDAKSFEILVEGQGNKLKGVIKERRKGFVSWIRFGEVGLRNLLPGVETFCKEDSKIKRVFDWKENGRSYSVENMENEAGSFILCSVTDGDGKRHRLFFPEERGLIKGWTLLVEKLKSLGLKGKHVARTEKKVEGGLGEGNKENIATQEGPRRNKSLDNCAWVNVGDCAPKDFMGTLKYYGCVVVFELS